MKWRDNGGFLLLEVILAGAIIAVVLFVLMECVGRSLAAGRSVQNYSSAQTLLANKSSEFRGERASDHLEQEGDCEEPAGFKWSRTFESTAEPGLWKQTITITWQERGQPVSDSIVEYRYLPAKQQ
jgi:type II secretion system protein I